MAATLHVFVNHLFNEGLVSVNIIKWFAILIKQIHQLTIIQCVFIKRKPGQTCPFLLNLTSI